MYYIDDTNYVQCVKPHHRFIAINTSYLKTQDMANNTVRMLDKNKVVFLPGVGIILDDITETSTLYIDDCIIYEIDPVLVSKNGETLMCNGFEVVRKFERKKEFFKYILENNFRMMERMYADIFRCFSLNDTYDLFEYLTDCGKSPISLCEIVSGLKKYTIGVMEEYKLIELIDMGYVIPVEENTPAEKVHLTLTSILKNRAYQLFCVFVNYMASNGFADFLDDNCREIKDIILLNSGYSIFMQKAMRKLAETSPFWAQVIGGTER